jgi:4-amino-4-deoxy-L-arabinose transferase-like glycosyltransferase
MPLPGRAGAGVLVRWWPLLALTALAAVLRLATLDHQSFWYDEAFTPVHVLRPGLGATLHGVVHSENSPPLWYLLAWVFERVLGDGEVALRLPSALAGIALVPVCWALGHELAGRGAAAACAALASFGPLFVWYSQEARVYALFALLCGVATVCFLRAERDPSPRRMAAFAASGGLALLTHYFAVFLLAPMALWLLRDARQRRPALAAVAAIAIVVAALLPLIGAQGGHGTQWIGRWALSKRLLAIPQYYLTGPSGEPLGHGIELLLALPLLSGCLLGLLSLLDGGPAAARERRGALLMALLAGCGVLVPLALAPVGADYLAPRNLIGAMVPLSGLIAALCCRRGAGTLAALLFAIAVSGLAAVSVDVLLSPRLQRGDWRGLARVLRRPAGAGVARAERAITTVELGSAPLEYYLPGLRNLARGRRVRVREIDETGYAPLRAGAGAAPARGFRLVARVDVHGLVAYRFLAPRPELVSEAELRRHVITLARPEVLVR